MIRFWIPIVFSLILAVTSFAKEITGAFGIKLGDDFSAIKKYILKNFESDSSIPIAYYVNPPKKNNLFDEYVVKVTPLTKKIASIIAIKKTTDGNCEVLLKALIEKLDKKYDLFGSLKRTPEGLSYSAKSRNDMSLLGKFITVECNKDTLILRYSDTALLFNLEQELGKVKEKEIDDNGL